MCVSTLSAINISETSGSIAIKFYLKHNCGGWGGGGGGGGFAALDFQTDWIKTVVTMVTDGSP